MRWLLGTEYALRSECWASIQYVSFTAANKKQKRAHLRAYFRTRQEEAKRIQ